MLSLNINDVTVENFYKQECNGDESTFIKNLINYIETYNIKKSVKKGLDEVKLQNSGELEKKELKYILADI